MSGVATAASKSVQPPSILATKSSEPTKSAPAACASCASFYPIVKEFKEVNDIDIYAVNLTDIFHDDNSVSSRVSYTPSLFIYKDGEVLAYLDPASDSDLPHYQTLEALSAWFASYLDVEIVKSDKVSDISDCESACTIE